MFATYTTNVRVQNCGLFIEGHIGNLWFPLLGKDLFVFENDRRIFVSSVGSHNQLVSLISGKEESTRNGYFLELLIVGLGFRFIKLGSTILLKLGFAHYIKLSIPHSIMVFGYKKKLIVFGLSKPEVNQFTRQLVNFRSPDVYKNKGIQLVGLKFRIKIGKQK